MVTIQFIRNHFLVVLNWVLMLGWAVLACLLLPTCNNAESATTTHSTDSDNSTDSETDTTASNTLSTDSDDTDTSSGYLPRIEQAPLTISVINQTSEIRYIWRGDLMPRCQYQNGAAWESCRFESYGSTLEECTESNLKQNCCLSVEDDSIVYALLPGTAVDYLWNAALYEEQTGHCSSCACLETAEPFAATYKIGITVYAAVQCDNENDCNLDVSGEIYAYGSGDPTVVESEFTLPTANATVELNITL